MTHTVPRQQHMDELSHSNRKFPVTWNLVKFRILFKKNCSIFLNCSFQLRCYSLHAEHRDIFSFHKLAADFSHWKCTQPQTRRFPFKT